MTSQAEFPEIHWPIIPGEHPEEPRSLYRTNLAKTTPRQTEVSRETSWRWRL